MSTWILPYNRFSHGARELSRATGYRRLTGDRSPRLGDSIINWGASKVPYNPEQYNVLNDCARTQVATNKLHLFQKLGDDVRTVPWTADKGIALEWANSGDVVARTVLTGHSGNGIVIIPEGSDTLTDAPLYTKYIRKAAEYRVHVAFGEVIDAQRKIRDPGREPTDWKVRSHQNGFIYVRNDVVVSAEIRAAATDAVRLAGLDFGAVDVITTSKGVPYVLEINTAPGITGQTLTSYSEAFKKHIGV